MHLLFVFIGSFYFHLWLLAEAQARAANSDHSLHVHIYTVKPMAAHTPLRHRTSYCTYPNDFDGRELSEVSTSLTVFGHVRPLQTGE